MAARALWKSTNGAFSSVKFLACGGACRLLPHAPALPKFRCLTPLSRRFRCCPVRPCSDLVDKMLARYSSDHVVLRELLQNADDARASHVEFRFTTGGPKTTGRKKACSIVELRELNNGAVFTEEDWTRVARIAEGNPNEDSVGMFGVGAFTPLCPRFLLMSLCSVLTLGPILHMYRILFRVFAHGVATGSVWHLLFGVSMGRAQTGHISFLSSRQRSPVLHARVWFHQSQVRGYNSGHAADARVARVGL